MTREKAEDFIDDKKIYTDTVKAIKVSDIGKLLNKIYDEFESRTCENCTFSGNNFTYRCSNSEVNAMLMTSYIGSPSLNPSFDFGCNKFEMKRD